MFLCSNQQTALIFLRLIYSLQHISELGCLYFMQVVHMTIQLEQICSLITALEVSSQPTDFGS